MAYLQLQNISKRFGDSWALRDVSLDVERGEIFGLLGAHGAGKSSLLRLISGNETPNTGTISIEGNDITALSADKRNFATLFHDNFSELRNTVAETLATVLKNRRLSKDEINLKVSEVLTLFELSDLETRRIRELSAGQKQLVALAGAILFDSQLFLLDSPLTNLDPANRERILETLKHWVKKSNSTVLYAAQNQDDAFSFCDRAAILKNGEILQIGTLSEIYSQPESVAVASFIGRNNLIRAARLTSNKEALSEFQTIEGDHRLFVDNVEKRRLGAINQIVTLMIRPENLILTFGAAFPEDNLLKGIIVEIRPFGATTRIRLDANGLILEALVIRLIGLKVGDVCLIGLPPNRITVLKD